MTCIWVSELRFIVSGNGMSPVQHQAITKPLLVVCCGNMCLPGIDEMQWSYIIRTLHDCPSQMNENLLISNSKLTSDSELIWWR